MNTKRIAFEDELQQQVSQCEEGGVYYGDTWGTTDITVEGSKGVVRLDLEQIVHGPITLSGNPQTFFLGMDEAEELLQELTTAIKEAQVCG
jgi:hypothetical protein